MENDNSKPTLGVKLFISGLFLISVFIGAFVKINYGENAYNALLVALFIILCIFVATRK